MTGYRDFDRGRKVMITGGLGFMGSDLGAREDIADPRQQNTMTGLGLSDDEADAVASAVNAFAATTTSRSVS